MVAATAYDTNVWTDPQVMINLVAAMLKVVGLSLMQNIGPVSPAASETVFNAAKAVLPRSSVLPSVQTAQTFISPVQGTSGLFGVDVEPETHEVGIVVTGSLDPQVTLNPVAGLPATAGTV